MNPRILALDTSSKVTGWSVVDSDGEELSLILFGELKMPKGHEAYVFLFNEISALIDIFKPAKVVIEDTYLSNTKTLKVLERIRGVAILACVNAGVKHIEQLNASTVRKRVFGDGKITKEDACTKLSDYFKKYLATKGYDQSDSIALAVAAHQMYLGT